MLIILLRFPLKFREILKAETFIISFFHFPFCQLKLPNKVIYEEMYNIETRKSAQPAITMAVL